MDELTNQSEVVEQETQETQISEEMGQENTTQAEQTTPQSIRVKYNHQELDLPYDEAVNHIQKGMNYEKAVERARQEAAQEARDSLIAAEGYIWKGKPITTEAEYIAAKKEQEMEQEIERKYAHLPDDVREEMLENRKFREQYQTQQQQIEAQQRQAQAQQDFASRRDSMYAEFLEEFPDQDFEAIPKEVFAEAEKWLKTGGREGRRLADAMTRHNWKQNMAQQQASEANQANAAASTGSVKAAAPPKGPLTEEMVEAMTDQERMARWPEIRKLYGMK